MYNNNGLHDINNPIRKNEDSSQLVEFKSQIENSKLEELLK